MDAPFDRGEVDRASLDATERLRARLSSRPPALAARRSRSFLPWAFAGGLLVFSAGMIANPWFESTVRGKLPFTSAVAPKPTDSAEVRALRERLAQLETRAGAPSAAIPSERLAHNEGRIETNAEQIAREAGRIDRLTSDVAALVAAQASETTRTQAATATAIAAADRAQGMLTLVLVHRAIESGRPLGALDMALRQSFEARYPDVVKLVTALGAAPVTLATLRRDFNALRPAIGVRRDTDRLSWWETLTSKISQAVSRSATDTPLALPDAANVALARGDYLAAAKYLRRLPLPRSAALANWLAAVDRLQTGSQALAALETAIVLSQPAITAPAPAIVPPAPPNPLNSPAKAAPPVAQNRIFWGYDVAGMVRKALNPRGLFGHLGSVPIG